MIRRVVLSLTFALIAAGAVSVLFAPQAVRSRAEGTPSVFLIPQAEGYGMSNCLAEGSECGRIVAQAWCESKGFDKVASWGVAGPADITGSVTSSRATAAAVQEPPLVITCEG